MSTPTARIEDPSDGVPATSSDLPPHINGPTVNITVVWGDLVEAAADLHVTGHYQSVVPDEAEHALDRAISAGPRPVITEHNRLGWIDAQLGEVTYFPCKEGPIRAAAVVGMGPLGTLNERRAVHMYASLLGEATALGHVATMATVLIGSGAGNLSVRGAARALVQGFATALASASPLAPTPRLTEVLVVEVDRLRAEQLLRALNGAAKGQERLHVTPALREGSGGRLFTPSAAVYALAALSGLVRPAAAGTDPDQGAATPDGAGPSAEEALRTVLAGLEPNIRKQVCEQLAQLAEVDRTDLTLTVRGPTQAQDVTAPVRMSVLTGPNALRWAALTSGATVPERVALVDTDLLRELVDRLTEPTVEDAQALPELLSRFVVPTEFQRLLTDDATVLLELDRDTASVPWEFLRDAQQAGGKEPEPLAIRTQLSRQLRTTYSRVPTEEPTIGKLSALVIGDPGDPQKGYQLPGARQEAVKVAAQLEALGVKVNLFVGAANAARERDAKPARRLDVLGALLYGGNDIVHYCGHSDFDRSGTGRRSGWVFADGLLTAQELGRLERPPLIVVANACYTARLGASEPAGAPDGTSPVADHSPWGNAQAALVPSLADEFLCIGVGHYIGSAWRIPDDQGISFAEEFYRHLFRSGPSDDPRTVGAAVRFARKALYEKRAQHDWADGGQDPQRWSAWAAYQHYGDASEPFVLTETPSDPQEG